MKVILLITCCFMIHCMAFGQQSKQMLEKYRWKNRLVLIFAPSTQNKAYQRQLQKFKDHKKGFIDRNLKVLHLLTEGASTGDDETLSQTEVVNLQQAYDIGTQSFSVVLIGKDGGQKLKQQHPLSVKKLFATIDTMPMRQREMQHDN